MRLRAPPDRDNIRQARIPATLEADIMAQAPIGAHTRQQAQLTQGQQLIRKDARLIQVLASHPLTIFSPRTSRLVMDIRCRRQGTM